VFRRNDECKGVADPIMNPDVQDLGLMYVFSNVLPSFWIENSTLQILSAQPWGMLPH